MATVSPSTPPAANTSSTVGLAATCRLCQSGEKSVPSGPLLPTNNALGRTIQPDEVAQVVLFLCANPGAAAITGADYAIDGGETA